MGKSTVKKILIAVFSSVCAMCIFGAISALFNRDACLFHEWDDGVVIKANTCKDEGEIIYTCYECGEEKAEVLAASARSHVWDSGTVTVEPVCETVGEKTYSCEICGEEKTEKLAYPGHSYGTGVVTQEPVCKKTGIMQWTCSVCGDQVEEELAAPGTVCVDESGDAVCDACNSVIPLKEGTYTEVAATVGETVAGNWYRIYFNETLAKLNISSHVCDATYNYSGEGDIAFLAYSNNTFSTSYNTIMVEMFYHINGIATAIVQDGYVDIYIHEGQLTNEDLTSNSNELTLSEPVTAETTITNISGEVYRLVPIE